MSRLTLTALTLLLTGCLSWQEAPLEHAGAAQVRVDEADVHYELTGPEDAPPVVLVHGFGSSTRVWGLLAADLARDHRVLALDLKGFGQSSRYAGRYDRRAHAEVVLAVMDEAGIRRADLVAHSMGSAVSLTVADLAPSRVGRLVLVGPWLFEDQVPWALRDARQPGLGELIFGLWFTEHLDHRFAWSFADPEAFVTEDVIDRAREVLNQRGSRAAALATIRGLDLPDLEGRLAEVPHATLIVQGASDRVAQPAFAQRLSVTLPHAEVELVPDAGHFPMLEAPARLHALVRRWFGSAP